MFDGQQVTTMNSDIGATVLFGFMDKISDIKSEEQLADEINIAEGEAEADGKRGTIENIREIMNEIDFDDSEAENKMTAALDELAANI